MSPLAAVTSKDAGASGLSGDWWVRALAAHERPGAPAAAADGPQPTRPGWGPRTPATVSGLEPQPGPEPGTHAAGSTRRARPGWAAVVEQAVAGARPPRVLPSAGTWQDAFATPLRPFLTGARDGLVAAARGRLSPAHAAPIRIADSYTAALGRQLAALAVRTMVHELRVAHDQGRLTGTDGRARFDDFIWRLCEPAGLAALLGQYPVLARLLGTASLRAARAGQELLIRYAADRPALVGSLLGGTDPGPAVAAEPGLGDRHRQGHSVTVVTFADGRKVVYKPRSLAAHALFGDVAGWLNQRVPRAGLRTARVVLRPGYGWQEFVTSAARAELRAREDRGDGRCGQARPGVDHLGQPGHPSGDRRPPWRGASPAPGGRLRRSRHPRTPGARSRRRRSRGRGVPATNGGRRPGATRAAGRRCPDHRSSTMSAVSGDAATGVPPGEPRMAGVPAATPARLLTAACGLGDQIVACGMSSSGDAAPPTVIRVLADGGTTARGGHRLEDAGGGAQTSGGQARVNWLGLQPVDGTPWVVLPIGAGLADGYLGVALFLAQLARLSGVSRYADVARRAVSPLPGLLSVLDGRPDLLATVGCGAAEGVAGISYALARMSTLLDDPALGEWADAAAHLTARLVAAPAGWPPVNQPGTTQPGTAGPGRLRESRWRRPAGWTGWPDAWPP
jgi:Domain of unknown function (DUF4135)